MQALPNGGMVVACGTGIEGCGPSVLQGIVPLAECQVDPRQTWRSYVVTLDAAGVIQWVRVDSFVEPGPGGVGTSAAEYVAVDQNGDLLVTTDQGFGIGMMKINMTKTAAPTIAPTRAPTQTPSQAPTPRPSHVPTLSPTN